MAKCHYKKEKEVESVSKSIYLGPNKELVLQNTWKDNNKRNFLIKQKYF